MHRSVYVGAIGYATALAGFVLAASPWAGGPLPFVDLLAPAWPAAAGFAVLALMLSPKRSAAALLGLASLALCSLTILALPRIGAASGSGPDGSVHLRVVTHNVWVDNVDPAGTAATLLQSGADVVLLQEVDGRFAAQLPVLRRAFPYTNTCRRRCSLMILSRYPIDRVRYRYRDAAGRQIGPGLIHTRVHLPGGVVVPVATIHLPRGSPREDDLARRIGLAEATRRADRQSLVLAGDFNLVPWSARLRWLDSALRPLVRTTAIFSYPARVAGRAFPLPLVPIDHLFAGPDWRVASVQQLSRTGSDHYPILVDLIWQGPNAMVTNTE